MNTDPVPPSTETPDQADIRLNKDVAAFSYIWIMSFVVYAARRNSPFASYHSKQGMVLCVLSFVWIIPWIGHLLTLVVAAGMVLGFIHAAQGLRLDVPFVGPISRGESGVQHIAEAVLKIFEQGWKQMKSLWPHHNDSKEQNKESTSTTPLDVK